MLFAEIKEGILVSIRFMGDFFHPFLRHLIGWQALVTAGMLLAARAVTLVRAARESLI